MSKHQRLELTWVGKENRPKLEPRILLEDPALSYHAKHRITDNDLFDNQLIQGDNLLALKALESEFTGKIKCVFIDPPYNTGSAFTHYDDGVEHSLWLSLMRDRLEIIRRLLAEDGSLWITIDDNEAHYLKVLLDEVFGRRNFVTNFIWRKVDSPNDNKVSITPDHEFILCYATDIAKLRFKRKSDPQIALAYGSVDENGVRYRDRLLKKNGRNSLREDRPSMYFAIKNPDGEDTFPIHDDGRQACWAAGKNFVFKLIEENKIVWKKRTLLGKMTWVPYTREYAPKNPERPYPTIWNDLTTMRQAKAHQKNFLPEVAAFDTPKPEELVSRVIEIATNPGDLILDSFAGSGTTGAVAQKMGRKWIMVELGEHAKTHIIPRLKKVIDGDDTGGVTEIVGWKGGGGFRFYRLAPSLLEQDRWGNWIINKSYNAEMLTEALCKLEGFTYAPSETVYWKHGYSTERDFVYVTTSTLTHEQLQQLSEEVGEEQTLLVLCPAFKGAGEYNNLTVKKIPKHVLNRCEWGHDDYSLRIENLPQMPVPEGHQHTLFAE
ncbi:site-specific DNA-methyltransferase [Spirosoma terrae]|uniref:site-specific DNA-methyltransferase (adenine-specific) n=1 Tax=Spirosoma terrae TaxID=1968276 RepID=A0A6L9L541_9BACT|nr:site-specific DNA-methyltransferase [Spirosoma terrae]NDU94231.1 site-specific DNA-methyltransferase [Spirosoma terrae]